MGGGLNSGPDEQSVAEVFSSTSESHDSAGGLFTHFGSMLVERAQLKSGQRVLDVAAGTGASLIPAAGRVGPTGRVVGLDLAPGMVDRLRRLIHAGGIANAEALLGDAEEMPFADESFDAVLCGFGLFFLPDPQGGLAEFRRVLRPGGTLALSTFTREGSATMDGIWQRIGAHVSVPPPADDERRFHDPAQLTSALERAGFTTVDVEPSPFELVLPDVDTWLSWLRSMEFREYLDRLDAPALERFRSSAADELEDQPGAPEIRLRMDALLTRARKPRAARPAGR